ILSGDFDLNLSKEKCLQNVLNYAKKGSIIVFHDSLKAEEKLRFVLPRVLEHYWALGFRFEQI
ncbi:MAG: polysaccharide deacetylase family protein, partial [Bacteroidota bacterium]